MSESGTDNAVPPSLPELPREAKLVVGLIGGAEFVNHTYLVLFPPILGLLASSVLSPALAVVAVVLVGTLRSLAGPARSKLADLLSARADLGRNSPSSRGDDGWQRRRARHRPVLRGLTGARRGGRAGRRGRRHSSTVRTGRDPSEVERVGGWSEVRGRWTPGMVDDGANVGVDGETDEPERKTVHLASWDDRFLAWLIDVILVGAVLSVFGEAAGAFSPFLGGLSLSAPFLGVNGLGLWIYWTALEGYRGQSAGKMVMRIAVTDRRGEEIDYATAAVESFGKAFLLPLDVLIGWVFMEDEYVRLFNRLSSTVVVERPEEDVPADVEYIKPEE